MKTLVLAAAAILTLAIPVLSARAADDDVAKMEALMREYLVLWNAHDAGTITQKVYRLEGNNPWSTREGLQAEFDRLKAQGYDHSDTSSIKGCLLSPDKGQVELRFVRLKTDGTAMPPGNRVSLYRLGKFPDGWRVTGMGGLPAGTTAMVCPAAPAPPAK